MQYAWEYSDTFASFFVQFWHHKKFLKEDFHTLLTAKPQTSIDILTAMCMGPLVSADVSLATYRTWQHNNDAVPSFLLKVVGIYWRIAVMNTGLRRIYLSFFWHSHFWIFYISNLPSRGHKNNEKYNSICFVTLCSVSEQIETPTQDFWEHNCTPSKVAPFALEDKTEGQEMQ